MIRSSILRAKTSVSFCWSCKRKSSSCTLLKNWNFTCLKLIFVFRSRENFFVTCWPSQFWPVGVSRKINKPITSNSITSKNRQNILRNFFRVRHLIIVKLDNHCLTQIQYQARSKYCFWMCNVHNPLLTSRSLILTRVFPNLPANLLCENQNLPATYPFPVDLPDLFRAGTWQWSQYRCLFRYDQLRRRPETQQFHFRSFQFLF